MSVFDNLTNLTINIKEAETTDGIVFENPLLVPDVAEFHAVQTGIITDTQVPIIGQLGDLGRIDPGACGVNTFSGTFPVSEKIWRVKTFSERLDFCLKQLPANFKVWRDEKIALKSWESIDRPLEQFLVDTTKRAVTRAIIRQAEFGDTGAVAGTNFTTGLDVALVTGFNGIWKQIFLDDAGAKKIKRVVIDANNLSTFGAQMALAPDAAYNILTEVTRGLDPEYYSTANEINITPDLWNNYIDFIKLKGGGYDVSMYMNGIQTKMFDGFKVNVRYDWKQYIEKYQKLTNTYMLPHRVTFTVKENLPVGTSDTQSFSELDMFYDKRDKKIYADVAWKLDSKLLLEKGIVVAY